MRCAGDTRRRLLLEPTIGGWAATARDGLQSFSSAMTFRTSGSQGDPKRCTHELSALCRKWTCSRGCSTDGGACSLRCAVTTSMDSCSVLDAAVRRMRPDDSSRLKAFVVLRGSFAANAAMHAELEAWVATLLTAPEQPRAFSFGATLPRDAAGKLGDWRVEPVNAER